MVLIINNSTKGNDMARKTELTQKIDKLVGARIRELRLSRGVSQTKLAGEIGVTFQQMQKYEKVVNRISAGRLFAVAKELGVSVGYFFNEDGQEEIGRPTGAMQAARIYDKMSTKKMQDAYLAMGSAITGV